MTDLEKFEKVWNGNFETTHWSGGINGFTRRAYKTKIKYEEILFSIWKHHPDWDVKNGFQIKCQDRTVYRVIDLAERAGLLIKVKNYSAGRHTRTYHKNYGLFDAVFKNQDNKYGSWLNKTDKDNKDYDIIHRLMIQETYKDKNSPYVDKSLKLKSRRYKKLNYDLIKLHVLCEKMLPHYLKLRDKLNDQVDHQDLVMFTWLKFDKYDMPTGRPYSYFCSTLNRNKKHKVIDPSMEYRDDFLKRIGLPDYHEVYDIKSEIPRINWLFHTGEWKPDAYDFYTEIIKDTEFEKYLDWTLDRGETKYTDYEDSMKQLFMRVYFGKGSDKQSYNGYLKDRLQRPRRDGMNFYEAQDEGYELNYDLWTVVCDSTNKICGPSIGNLIFWYAFFIETEVKIELLKRGKKVYNVYDGFYYNEDIKDEIIDILDDKAKYVYNKSLVSKIEQASN
jgi:hypothetical protein